MTLIERLTAIRRDDPDLIRTALAQRRRPAPACPARHLIIACDHPARAALGAGGRPMAMADREDLLARASTALARPGVTGFLGTADLIEDLALLGALDGKNVWGSMNRGGLYGSSFEIDDRFTAYTPGGIERAGLDGGKMLLRIDYADPATPRLLESASAALDGLAERGLSAMIEPFLSTRRGTTVVNDLDPDAVITSIAIAQGLGSTTARTWLKLPCVPDMERVMQTTTLPSLILGGEVPADPDRALSRWESALALPNVCGLVVGRSLLYPADDDVVSAVDRAVALL
ncbi:deoxyribose-phosphate aldolase [Actinomyces sp. B33]|uniref:Cgl0159 family (beta/alpha)8-fold protein n=1 Tax=Actinomyces sp. B33 TaxID=2942131 RepID=UPI00233FADC7|nr:deoxyribose-phosphate aldolase [Actinomyces sp. B33]MDC4232489.1 deoxyribose-phosphate aldolase [Actinomyces sp. B33]